MQGSSKAMFGHEVGRMKAVENLITVREWVFRCPVVFRKELPAVGNMAFGPFELVQFRQILDEIFVGLETFRDRAEIDYSGAGELIPNLPDNGVG